MDYQLLYTLSMVLIKNGLYIPFLYTGLYFITQDIFLSTTIALKGYTTNYFYWFGSQYTYLPAEYNWLKQFIRFTDTGTIASMIYYFCPEFLPIAYNIHFIITFGYWIGKLQFVMKDADSIEHPIIIKQVEKSFCALNHSLPLCILLYKLRNTTGLYECYSLFTWQDLKYTYYWAYVWFFCIYIPWRMYTKDYVYTVLEPQSPIQYKIAFITILHIIALIGNISGYLLQPC